MPDLNQLREEHEGLVIVGRRLGALIASDSPPPPAELYAIRMDLASKLLRHLKTEDWVLYPRLLASKNAHVAATARAFSEEMGGLCGAFKDYSERWGAAAIEADWGGYRDSTRQLLQALTQRMTRENRELYPLLETDRKTAA